MFRLNMSFAGGEFKVNAKVARIYSLKTYGGVESYLRPLLTLALYDVRDQLRAPTSLSPDKGPQVLTEEKAGCSSELVWTLC
jgi:hypothetical protein